jgi:RimJ/RimL family protein N-acetyltransferase
MLSQSEQNDAPVLNVTGQQVALGPLRRDLVPQYQRWLNDFRHARNFDDTPEPWTAERASALFEARACPPGDVVMFTIFALPNLRPIGYTMLTDVSFRHRSAEFSIHIGEADAHGKGYGTETATLMLEYAFGILNLNTVHLTVAEYNLAGRRAYERAGFRECGRRRQAWLMGGRFWDVILMECLSGEFANARPACHAAASASL